VADPGADGQYRVVPPAVGPDDAALPPDPVGLFEGLCTTRAIRRYRPEPVPDRALRDILFAATRAPSGSNRQPFRFIVLTDGPRAREAKEILATGARQVWDVKKTTDRYDQGSGHESSSPKARMARTMQEYVDHLDEVPVRARTCCWPPGLSGTAGS
jgi:hypothetical protein